MSNIAVSLAILRNIEGSEPTLGDDNLVAGWLSVE